MLVMLRADPLKFKDMANLGPFSWMQPAAAFLFSTKFYQIRPTEINYYVICVYQLCVITGGSRGGTIQTGFHIFKHGKAYC